MGDTHTSTGNSRNECIAAHGGIGHNAALAHQRRRSFKLRLYERAECTRRHQARQYRIDNVRDAGKRDITHSQVDGAGIAKLRQLRHVCALMQRHAIVLTQRPIELGATHVHRDNGRSSALEQAIGKTPGRAAHIQTGKARRIDTKRIKRAFELKTAAANIGNAAQASP